MNVKKNQKSDNSQFLIKLAIVKNFPASFFDERIKQLTMSSPSSPELYQFWRDYHWSEAQQVVTLVMLFVTG